ncbi:uncharacterized protein LOC117906277 [Vitis riparia]|uniref:uncharacterized protein LOC117906277 n=1 Tax=Vitis riparia TaxID=96939 RepID=UPI00155A3B64|nr:uncharacterized protein LOC117906277 [Vitis riparia]
MTLNCLNCGPALQRTDSDTQKRYEDRSRLRLCRGVERSWSGNLAPPPSPYGSMRHGSAKKAGKGHRRLNSVGEEPKLIRSGGMRRDWSFEDLRQRRDEKRILLNKA